MRVERGGQTDRYGFFNSPIALGNVPSVPPVPCPARALSRPCPAVPETY
jgi:hypothetical protein